MPIFGSEEEDMASGCYYCVPHPLPLLKSELDLVDTGLRMDKRSTLAKLIVRYMNEERTRYVSLSTPNQSPRSFDKSAKSLIDKFPEEYVHDLEGLLNQSKVPRVLVVSLKDGSATTLVNATTKYDSVVLSFFTQSVQQRNPTAGILYEMIGRPPPRKKGVFLDCETLNCCFRHSVVRLIDAERHDSLSYALALDVRFHQCVNNMDPEKIPVDTMMKWFRCSPVDYLT